MTGFLLDTNVLSEFSRSTIQPNAKVKYWIESTPSDALFTSVLSLGEIRKGIDLLPPGKRRDQLELWLAADLNGWFGNNLLSVTQAIASRWGKLAARSQQQGRPLGNVDGLLAATALEHNLMLVTHNIRHFTALGVSLFDPWES